MSYIDKINSLVNEIQFNDNWTATECVSHFSIEVESNIAVRLETMTKFLEKMDNAFKEIKEETANKSVADSFSERYEQRILNCILVWIDQDESLRTRFKSVCKKYERKMPITGMKNCVFNNLDLLHDDILAHVKDANDHGKEWTVRIDNAGFVISNPIIKTTISWFEKLTVSEVEADYMRDI